MGEQRFDNYTLHSSPFLNVEYSKERVRGSGRKLGPGAQHHIRLCTPGAVSHTFPFRAAIPITLPSSSHRPNYIMCLIPVQTSPANFPLPLSLVPAPLCTSLSLCRCICTPCNQFESHYETRRPHQEDG